MGSYQYTGISGEGGSRQHLGNVINTTTNHYHQAQPTSQDAQTKLNHQFLKAAREGQTTRLKVLADRGADPDFALENGLTALHYACWSPYEDTVLALLGMNVDINAVSDDYGTPLCIAAGKGRRNAAKGLLEHRASVRASAREVGSLLHAAVIGGDEWIFTTLLEHGALPDGTFSCDYTLFHDCDEPGRHVLEENFICTPLFLAAHYDRRVIAETLLNHGACLSSIHSLWSSLESLHHGRWSRPRELTCVQAAAYQNSAETLKVLLERGADPDQREHDKENTALIWAAIQNRLQCVAILLKNGASVDLRGRNGNSALMHAAQGGFHELVQLLLQEGASTRLCNYYGETALWMSQTRCEEKYRNDPDYLRKKAEHKACCALLEEHYNKSFTSNAAAQNERQV